MCDMGKRGEVAGLTPRGAGWGLLAQARDTDRVQSQVSHVTQGLGLWMLVTADGLGRCGVVLTAVCVAAHPPDGLQGHQRQQS